MLLASLLRFFLPVRMAVIQMVLPEKDKASEILAAKGERQSDTSRILRINRHELSNTPGAFAISDLETLDHASPDLVPPTSFRLISACLSFASAGLGVARAKITIHVGRLNCPFFWELVLDTRLNTLPSRLL